MPMTQFDIGLGDIGQGIKEVTDTLASAAIRKQNVGKITDFARDFSSEDEVVNGYLNAAIKYADRDMKLSKEFLEKAMERSGQLVDTNTEFQRKDPMKYITYFDERNGKLDVHKTLKEKEKEEQRRQRLLKFMSNVNPARDLKFPEAALLETGVEEATYKEDADPYMKALKDVMGEQGRDSRASLNIFGKESKDFWERRSKVISEDKKIYQDKLNKNNEAISKLQERKLGGNSDYARQNDANIDAQIQIIRNENEYAGMKLRSLDEQEQEVWEKKGVTTDMDRDRKTILEYFQAAFNKLGDERKAAESIEAALRNPQSKFRAKLKNKFNTSSQYGVFLFNFGDPANTKK